MVHCHATVIQYDGAVMGCYGAVPHLQGTVLHIHGTCGHCDGKVMHNHGTVVYCHGKMHIYGKVVHSYVAVICLQSTKRHVHGTVVCMYGTVGYVPAAIVLALFCIHTVHFYIITAPYTECYERPILIRCNVPLAMYQIYLAYHLTCSWYRTVQCLHRHA